LDRLLEHHHADGEGAARDVLTIHAVAGVDHDWRLRDIDTDGTTETAASHWKINHGTPRQLSRLARTGNRRHRAGQQWLPPQSTRSGRSERRHHQVTFPECLSKRVSRQFSHTIRAVKFTEILPKSSKGPHDVRPLVPLANEC
jgi:hypothetical protein